MDRFRGFLGSFRYLSRLCLLLAMIVLLGSCTQRIPVILDVSSEIVNYEDTNDYSIEKRLSLFIHLEGDDEHHDIDRIIVEAPVGSYLSWEIDSDHFFTRYFDGELWIGSNTLTAPDTSGYRMRFPDGTYTVRVVSTGGYEDTIDFELIDDLDYTSLPDLLFPVYNKRTGTIEVDSTGDIPVRLKGYDSKMRPLGSVEVTVHEPLASQKKEIEAALSKKIVCFELELTDPVLHQVFRSGIYSYPD